MNELKKLIETLENKVNSVQKEMDHLNMWVQNSKLFYSTFKKKDLNIIYSDKDIMRNCLCSIGSKTFGGVRGQISQSAKKSSEKPYAENLVEEI